jgi:UDP-2-acetamido-3-amino-2,3-dideoxy-glucuronate N-acetyltransferase
MAGMHKLPPGDLTDRGDGVLVHPASMVAPDAVIGRGTRIFAFSQVLSGAIIGENCTIGAKCIVYGRATLGSGVVLESTVDVWSEVHIGDDVFVGPSVVFTNDLTPRAFAKKGGVFIPTHIDEGSSIGANATIVCGIRIGRFAGVGAGAVVRKDVPAHALVVGTLGKRIGWICLCNQWGRLRFDNARETACGHCGRRYALEGTDRVLLL